MKKMATLKSVFLAVSCFSVLTLQGCQKSVTDEPNSEALSTIGQKATYIRSYRLAQKAARNGLQLDPAVMVKALSDVKAGLPPVIPESEHSALMDLHKVELLEVKRLQSIEEGKRHKREGEAFLVENAKNDDIVVTNSGLQYRVVKSVGSGVPKPKKSDWVKVKYVGKFLDGAIFKNTTRRYDTKSFELSGVIEGWVEGIQLMRVGEKFEFFVPSELAYGDQGDGGRIGMHRVLHYEIELTAIEELDEVKK